ncbi:hypothetical protein [Gymnodinialimonas sp.]
MSSAIGGTILTLGTVYLCCAIALAWSAYSKVAPLARILRYSGIFWAIWLTLSFALFTYLTTTCSGNWLYGFTDCARLSEDMADSLTSLSILSFLGGMAYGAALLVGGGITEIIARVRAS